MKHVILGIESSCDDTAAAVLADGQLLSSTTATQEAHRLYGGVVPEVASRAHLEHIVPVVHQALAEANLSANDLTGIAFTRGPGLLGSLMVGAAFAKGLCIALNQPLIAVHHMKAHILAHFIEAPQPTFPFLCLTVSGGHTQLVRLDDLHTYTVLGQTLDDAAGEAFDKTGKMLGLDYPAGPIIDRLAKTGTPKFEFPEPKTDGLNFSFSGLKTSIRTFLQRNVQANPNFIEENLADICASVQTRIVSILLNRLAEAAAQTGITQVGIAGGVSANSALRQGLTELGNQKGWTTYIPKFGYCTDNAAMIAMAGYANVLNEDFANLNVKPTARWEF